MKVKRIMGIIALLVALIPAASQVRSQVVKIQNVDLSFSAPSYQPVAVNNNDWVVGYYLTVGGVTRGFLNPGLGQATQTISFPGSVRFTRAIGINDSNTVVGDFFGPDGVYHGYFYYADGTYSPAYDLPGFDEHRHKFSTSLFGISAGGNLAGAGNPNVNTQGFVVIGGTTFLFYGADTDNTYAYAVNDAGVAVGEFLDSGNTPHGFMWSAAGGVTEIAYPGASWTVCNGINNSGEITGTYLDGSGFAHGFTYVNGTFDTLDLPAVGVSNSGSYVGTYTAPGGAQRGYEASPTSIQTPITVNVPGAQSTSLYGENFGTFVGKYTDVNGVSHGMALIPPNGVVTLDDPDASGNSTVCQGLLAHEYEVVLNYTDSGGNSHAALFDFPRFLPISITGAISVSVYGIVQDGATENVSGTYTDIFNNTYGFVQHNVDRIGEETRTVQVPGATFTIAYGLNTHGYVSAFWGNSAGYVESSVCHDIGSETVCAPRNLPGATNCYVAGIDDNGDLVFNWTDAEGNVHGGYYDNTAGSQVYYLLDYPGGTGTRAYGIERPPGAPGPVIVGRYLPTATSNNFNGFEWDIW